MTIETDRDIIGLMRIGRIVGLALRTMQDSVQAGMTTQELDDIGAAFLSQHHARSAPGITYRVPGVTCISVEDEAAHGIPGSRVLREGDLVKIDVSAELDGYFADANLTVPIGAISARKQKLLDCTRAALDNAIDAARAGRSLNAIGRAAEQTAQRCGFNVIRELPGHGVGRALHEAPTVPNFYMRRANLPLEAGMVFTVEPHVAMGKGHVVTDTNGWVIRTRDHSPVASFEHTVIVTDGQPILVTAV
ncbi:MAG: type I methionyl aminopeptidase [Anaerolineae bacterium]|nr:type I methionyl aminopeptidase [Anaerolineae bacterium]